MRKVHAMLRSRSNPAVIISFIQHGNREEGWAYEFICPYCAKTVGWFQCDDEFGTEQQVYSTGKLITGRHIDKCQFNGASTLAVEKTTEPLHTEKIPRIL